MAEAAAVTAQGQLTQLLLSVVGFTLLLIFQPNSL